MKEITIAKVDDLQNGQMKQITVGDSQLLLSKINDKFYTTGAFCTHYGAPLEQGILCGERIICPWHNACFNAIAGQQEEPPGLDSLASFPTKVVGDWDEIYLDGDLDQPKFLAFYLQGHQVMAVAGVNRDREIAAISELMRQQKMPDAKVIKEQSIDWMSKI